METAKQRLNERNVCESMVVRENGFRVKVSKRAISVGMNAIFSMSSSFYKVRKQDN